MKSWKYEPYPIETPEQRAADAARERQERLEGEIHRKALMQGFTYGLVIGGLMGIFLSR
jgi:hypothetical protein